MPTLSYLALLAGCAFGALLLYRQPEPLTQQHKTIAHLYVMSSAFIAVFAILKLVTDSTKSDSATMQLFFENLSYFIALPLMASLLFAKSIGRYWERNYWGRWMLFLFAMFELLRRAGYGAEYSTILSLSLVGALIATFSRPGLIPKARLTGLISSLFIGAALYLAGKMAALDKLIAAEYNSSLGLSAALLAVGLAGVGYATGKLLAQPENTSASAKEG